MKSKKLAELAIAVLEDMKGQSIRCINVEKLTAITDYMIIVTGTSSTHIRALADAVVVKLKTVNQQINGVEGKLQSEWVLVDAGGVVVHIMMAPVRALYNLEELWDFKTFQAGDRGSISEDISSVVPEKPPEKSATKSARSRPKPGSKRGFKPGPKAGSKPGSKPGSNPAPRIAGAAAKHSARKTARAKPGKRDGTKAGK